MAHAHSAVAGRDRRLHISWRQAVIPVCFVALLYGIVPQLGGFRRSLHLLGSASPALVGIGIALTAATFFVAALMYWTLALKPVRYWRAALVQGASGFTNRLLPAGLGGMGINAAFLHKSRHSVAQAAVVAVVNNTLGFAGHLVLLALVLLLYPIGTFHINVDALSWLPYVLAAAAVLAILAAAVYVGKFARTATRQFAHFWRAFRAYGAKKRALSLALVMAMCITLLMVSILYVSCRAVGADVPVASVFVAFTVGMVATVVTPTPGGLGGAEAGLVAALTGFGVSAAAALAAVLLFRLLTYWLPIVPGFALFGVVLHRGYVG